MLTIVAGFGWGPTRSSTVYPAPAPIALSLIKTLASTTPATWLSKRSCPWEYADTTDARTIGTVKGHRFFILVWMTWATGPDGGRPGSNYLYERSHLNLSNFYSFSSRFAPLTRCSSDLEPRNTNIVVGRLFDP